MAEAAYAVSAPRRLSQLLRIACGPPHACDCGSYGQSCDHERPEHGRRWFGYLVQLREPDWFRFQRHIDGIGQRETPSTAVQETTRSRDEPVQIF
jgi:hypothetical protein